VLVDSKLDIFRRLPGGQLVWIGAMDGLEETKQQVRRLADSNAGDYFVYDVGRGRQIYSISESPAPEPNEAKGSNLE
jgi:hypothetical protein